MRNIGIAAAIGVAIGLCSLVASSYNIAQGSIGLSQASQRDLIAAQNEQTKKTDALSSQLQADKARIDQLAAELEALAPASNRKKQVSPPNAHPK
jgi:hypothetical protein